MILRKNFNKQNLFKNIINIHTPYSTQSLKIIVTYTKSTPTRN